MPTASGREDPPLRELARLFAKLGVIGFGGPAAHIALMQDEVVERRRWLSDQHFLDLVGATNVIPGPNSTELAIHIGRERAGWRGLVVAGSAFIAPAMVIVLVLASLYVEFGTSPAAQNVLYGITPVVIAIIVDALWKLARVAFKNVSLGILGVVVFTLFLVGVNELLLLALSALVVSLVANRKRLPRPSIPLIVSGIPALGSPVGSPAPPGDLGWLFLLFLKFGSVVFGSGYVLLAFIRADLVTRLGWLTNEQLVDAIAIGQLTPGPVFTTATFIGYLVAGVTGAIVATIAIFLPSFFFVAAIGPLVSKIRRSPWLAAALDGLNVASVALMAGVTVQLGGTALVDAVTVVLAAAALAALWRWRPNPAWLIFLGATVGGIRWLIA
ncbi:MAG TPA: chromate efflux transporter [Actinomycetota bacterium]|nr:chromate efflux transporter [Actinomycetota bacterium]